MADGLALADGVAIGGDLADGVAIGGDLADVDAIGEDMEELSSSSELEQSEDAFSKVLLNFAPATLSQSTVSLRPRMTLALRWNEPEANPS